MRGRLLQPICMRTYRPANANWISRPTTRTAMHSSMNNVTYKFRLPVVSIVRSVITIVPKF